ncbi:hypothetical protein AB0F15_25675 [Amycolatopsis sp. NPDC026612]|uniref:hypothetical protein n=1 Tax=Amycolatopsis sp. NPDC026612 TaxID=3155466 RepID=UPI0034027C3A
MSSACFAASASAIAWSFCASSRAASASRDVFSSAAAWFAAVVAASADVRADGAYRVAASASFFA